MTEETTMPAEREAIVRIAKGLSGAQRKALLADRTRGNCAYSLRVGLNTLEALRSKGLVLCKAGVGAMAFPHTTIEWPLTSLGQAVRDHLKESTGDGK